MPGTHQPNADPDDCPPDCRGCGQAEADHGLELCRVCTRRIGHDAWRIAWLHAGLSQALTGTTSRSAGGGHSARPDPGLNLRDPAVEARDAVRNTLVSLARLISEERGIALPWRHHHHIEQLPPGFIGPPRRISRIRGDNTAQAMAAYIGRHATWLAAHPAAGEHAETLRDVALDGRLFTLAFPAGTGRRQLLGVCPLPSATDPDVQCHTPIHAGTSATITCRGCKTSGSLDWWYRTIVGELPPPAGPVSAIEAAWRLSGLHGQAVGAEAVRKWGQRAHRTGVTPCRLVSLVRGQPSVLLRDQHGRALYRWDDLTRYANRIYQPQEAAA
jgi:hypothetical protein